MTSHRSPKTSGQPLRWRSLFDCEKLGWQEVVWTTLPSIAYQQDIHDLYTKITRDLRETQRTIGLCPAIAPSYLCTTSTPSQGMYDDAPAWGSSAFMAPWQLYNIYGDARVLQDNAYLKTKEAGGLVKHGLGDWMAPGGAAVANVEGGRMDEPNRLLAALRRGDRRR